MNPELIDKEVVAELRREGFGCSKVMEWAGTMTDVYGPRYANSPSYDAAAEWARQTFESFGLSATLQAWGEYGYGWENEYTSAHLMRPRYQPLIAYSMPGTAGTSGAVTAGVALVDTTQIFDDADLDPYRGKLHGQIVFTQPERRLQMSFEPQAVRLSDEELQEMARPDAQCSEGQLDDGSDDTRRRADPGDGRQPMPPQRLHEFFRHEGTVALMAPGGPNVGPMDKGLVNVTGAGPHPLGEQPGLPSLVLAAEHYNRIVRLIGRGIEPEIQIEVRNAFHDDDSLDYNVLAELPGSDLSSEVVMIGAHFDSESAGTGATDNASGSAVVMEAMRILAAVDAKPRRTIRAALWGAEESGMLGSRGYVAKHLGSCDTGERLPGHADHYVYFNVDWYGRIRGIFLQGNDEARPIFEAWMQPFHDVGMEWIVPGNTGGTDHMAFLEVGLPGFQFVQDDLEFFNVSFHTNMDVYDRLVEEDLEQASVILASFAYHAATREGSFPRADGLNNGRRWHK
jgi:hypothetical protein